MNLQVFQVSVRRAVSLTAIAAGTLISLPALAQSTPGSTTVPATPSEVTPGSVTDPATPATPAAPAVPTAPVPGTTITPETTPGTTAPGTTTPGATTAPSTAAPETSTTPGATTAPETASSGTIVDVANSSGNFKTLVAALKAAGLTDVLSAQGPFTVFAPTDKAFAALPKGTVEALLKPENKEKLRKVLTYHVLSGKVESTAIKGGRISTVEGSPVALAVKNGGVTVNNAKVTTPDIEASNGVIHVIDKVILPPNL